MTRVTTVWSNSGFGGVLSVLHLTSGIKNTTFTKQKAVLFTFYLCFTPVIHCALLATEGQAKKEKTYFFLPQGLCRTACGAEMQTAFMFDLALQSWILLADSGTSLPAFPWQF